tara:strand:- start:578 stop:712 length:135 start_codon:yes stop_codon:yes gene_type:complete
MLFRQEATKYSKWGRKIKGTALALFGYHFIASNRDRKAPIHLFR